MDVRAVLSGLASGALTDFDEEAARGLAFVTERGLLDIYIYIYISLPSCRIWTCALSCLGSPLER